MRLRFTIRDLLWLAESWRWRWGGGWTRSEASRNSARNNGVRTGWIIEEYRMEESNEAI